MVKTELSEVKTTAESVHKLAPEKEEDADPISALIVQSASAEERFKPVKWSYGFFGVQSEKDIMERYLDYQ